MDARRTAQLAVATIAVPGGVASIGEAPAPQLVVASVVIPGGVAPTMLAAERHGGQGRTIRLDSPRAWLYIASTNRKRTRFAGMPR